MLGGREGFKPKGTSLLAAAAYFASAKSRAGAALRGKLALHHAALSKKFRHREFLDDADLRFVVRCEPMIDVVAVAVLSDSLLRLEFSNGEGRILSLARFLDELQGDGPEAAGFLGARVSQGSLVWPGGIDLATETLYELSVPAP